MFFSGIDLCKNNYFTTTGDDGGAIVKQERLPDTPDIILAYFDTLQGSHKVVVECPGGW